MIGRTTDSGMPIAVENVSWVIASSGAHRITARGGEHGDDADARHQPEAGAGVEHLAQLDRDEAGHRDRAYVAGRGAARRSSDGRGRRSRCSCCCSFTGGRRR